MGKQVSGKYGEPGKIGTRTWIRTKQCKRNRTGARIRSRKGIRHKAKSEKTTQRRNRGRRK